MPGFCNPVGEATGEVIGKPEDSGFKIVMQQMHDQINGASAAATVIPVKELGSGDRDCALWCMPFSPVIFIPDSAKTF